MKLLESRPIQLGDVRIAGAAMVGAAAMWSLLPDGTGIPCPLRSITGVPCPLCGMTTSVTATVRGDLAAAFAANPAGILAVLAAVVLLVVWRAKTVRFPAATIPIALAAMWLFELRRFTLI